MKVFAFALSTLSASSFAIAAPETGAHKAALEARHAQLLEARQDLVSSIVEMATGIFNAIIGEAIGGDLLADFANAVAAALQLYHRISYAEWDKLVLNP